MPQFAPRVVASAWVRQNLVIDALRVLGVPTMRMRYEDWVTGPDAALERVLAFAGLGPRPNEHVGPDWVHTYDGSLTPERLEEGLAWALETPRGGRAPLASRDWDVLARQTVDAYRVVLGDAA